MKRGLTIVLFNIIFVSALKAQTTWTLDPNFGDNGITRVDFGPGYNDFPNDILLLPDGKILTAGQSTSSFDLFIAMSQLLPNGQPDVSGFGTDGEVLLHFVLRDHAKDIEVQPDGKILAVGTEAIGNGGSQITPALYRFNTDGSLDTSFADSGKAVHRFSGNLAGEMYGVKILSDDKIVTAGYRTGSAAFGVMRFLSDGERDLSFGNNGEAVLPNEPTHNHLGCLFLQDTAIVMATVSFTGGLSQFILAMMDSSGNPHPLFGSDGIIQTGIDAKFNFSGGESLALTNEGKLILSGTTPDSGPTKFSVFRFLLDGTIDTTFGTNGRTDIQFTTNNVCHDMQIDQNGKILLVGSVSVGFGMAGIARLNPDGTPDTTFAPDGKIIVDLNNNSGTHYLTRCIPLDNGDILAAGWDFASNSGDFMVTRLTQNPTGIDDQIFPQPNEFTLYQNFPNPFNPSTNIKYRISDFGFVSLKVFDVLGNEVATLVNEEKPAGNYVVEFNSHSDEGQNLSSGIYFYKLQAGSFVETKKMILLK
jgi:uncharacterized delta-60 repeat protein